MAEAVVSFVVEKLGNLLIEEVASLYDVHEQVESMDRELTRMQCFLKDADVKQKSDERVNNWVRDIRDIAYEAEDIIDTFVLKLACQGRSPGLLRSCKYCFTDLPARHELGKEIKKIKERISNISISRVTYGIENICGGERAIYVCEKLRERRRSSPHDHDIAQPRVTHEECNFYCWDGGLGKTTLAKKVYNCSDVKRHFDLCAWVYVSQVYKGRELLHEIGRKVLNINKGILAAMSNGDLQENLYKAMSKKRNLIVMDDIWKIEVWDDLKAIFPDVNNGSRVLFTTRIKEVAACADPRTPLHELRLLSDAQSWELFTKKAFPLEADPFACPPELKKLGKWIVAKCGGLPFAIVILGGLLSRKEKTTSVWSRLKDFVRILGGTKGEVEEVDSIRNVESLVVTCLDQYKENLRSEIFDHLKIHEVKFQEQSNVLQAMQQQMAQMMEMMKSFNTGNTSKPPPPPLPPESTLNISKPPATQKVLSISGSNNSSGKKADIWFQGWQAQHLESSWINFGEELCLRFGELTMEDVVEEFNKIKQKDTAIESLILPHSIHEMGTTRLSTFLTESTSSTSPFIPPSILTLSVIEYQEKFEELKSLMLKYHP
ncbi:phosphoprotein phosphatase, putative [Ricinus communis]|uniref:Phosphoprotein phosphatase, putative n=1 Tax=Ricinus communis TaxID=3988 RepID=B9SGW3_RICCO|nr:phosphoprotein phosphatase, putative [Ricinus communis]